MRKLIVPGYGQHTGVCVRVCVCVCARARVCVCVEGERMPTSPKFADNLDETVSVIRP